MRNFLIGVAAVSVFLIGSEVFAQTASSTSPIPWTLTGMWAPPSSGTTTPTSILPQASELPAPQEISAIKYNSQRNTVYITWIEVYGAKGYKIVRTGGSGGSVTGYSQSNDWTDPLPWGASETTYTYTITALDQGGNEASTTSTYQYSALATAAL